MPRGHTEPESAASLGLPPVHRSAAFFDVDNTLIVGASTFHFARGLAAREFFTPRDLLTFALMQARFRVRGKEHRGDLRHLRESALTFVAGKPVADLVSLGTEIYDDTIAPRIWSGTLALAQQHLAAGRDVWLVTATPVELAQMMADRLGFTGALGTVAERVDGVYTGHLVGEVLHGQAKADAVRRLATEHGYDLDECFAYSDSVNDLPLLQSVGRPNPVNPDAALRAIARDRNWPTHEFRTTRRAAKVCLPVGAAAGLVIAGAIVAHRIVSARRTCAARAAGRGPAGWFRVPGR